MKTKTTNILDHEHEKRYTIVLDFLRSLEKLSGITLRDARYAEPRDPIGYAAREACRVAARKHDASELVFVDDISDVPSGFTPVSVPGKKILAYNPAMLECNLDAEPDEISIIELIVAINALRWSVTERYVLLHYDLIACYTNPALKLNDIWTFCGHLLEECRSVVVNIDDMSIASLPFYKFHNLGENEEYRLEAVRNAITENRGHASITEKLDGSFIQMRFIADSNVFDNGLLYSTSNTLACSENATHNEHITALRRLHLSGSELEKHISLCVNNPDKTFIFEFVHPEYDPHVVSYARTREGLYLIGARDVSTGILSNNETLDEIAASYDIPRPRIIAGNLDEALEIQKNGDGSLMEGMVANVSGWLIKIKLDSFLLLSQLYHKFDGGHGFKSVCEALYTETLDDMISALPDAKREIINATIERLETYNKQYDDLFTELLTRCLAVSGNKPIGKSDNDNRAWKRAFAGAVNTIVPQMMRGDMFAYANGKLHAGAVHWVDNAGDNVRYLNRSEFEKRCSMLDECCSEFNKNKTT